MTDDHLEAIGGAVLERVNEGGKMASFILDRRVCPACGRGSSFSGHESDCPIATHLDSTPDDADSFLADNECPDCQLPLVDVTEHSDERLRLICPKCNEEYRKPRSTPDQEEA